jgi:beta-barrel assembly-enhancing protease
MKNKIYSLLILLTAFMVGSSQAQFGDLLKKGVEKAKRAKDTFQPWSPEQEDAIGQASAAKMIHVLGFYENPEMMKYVNLVGNTVARAGARNNIQYHFGILDSEIVSAFALPGGYIFVTRGALANMKNESELAGVLAHEVAHVDSRHLEKEVRNKKATHWAVEEGSAKVPAPSELKNIANDMVANALTSSYGRDKEAEADKKGLEFATAAGYDPAGLRNFLQVLATAAADPANQRTLGLWNNTTHPPFAERVANLDKLMASKSGGQELADRFTKSVDFTKPPVTMQAQTASATHGPNPCSLDDAKARIAYEREALDNLGKSNASSTKKPPANCSFEDAKAKIAEAKAELDKMNGGTAEKQSTSNQSSAAKPQPATQKKAFTKKPQ